MEKTYSYERKLKFRQHSGNFVLPRLSEQTLSREALGENDNSAFQLLHTRSRDHKADRHISATLAPPIWNGEDDSVATRCKRIKLNSGKPTRQYHSSILEIPANAVIVSAGDVAAGPKARALDGNPRKLGVDGYAREKGALSGKGDPPKKRTSSRESYEKYRRNSSSSFPDYGSLNLKVIPININKNSMVAGERRTSGVPGGPFRPQNTLQRNLSGSSSISRPSQKKVFNLRDGEYTIPGEHHAAKRQKIDPQRTIRKESSSNVIDLSESHSRLDATRSLSSKGSVPEQPGGSRFNHKQANLFQVGEYRKVEAIVSFDRSYKSSKPSGAEPIRRRSSGEGHSARKLKNVGEKRGLISFEAVEAEEVKGMSVEPKSHQSTANGPVSRPKAVWSDLNPPSIPEHQSAMLERSPHFVKKSGQTAADIEIVQPKFPNGHINGHVSVETTAPKRRLSSNRVTRNAVEEVQYLDEDSVDLLTVNSGEGDGEDVLPKINREADIDIHSGWGITGTSTLPKSKSISNEGDIPRSALARAQPKTSQKQTRGILKPKISFNIEYIRTGAACFELQKGCMPWQFQFDYDKNEFDLFGIGDSITEKSPGLVLKPGNIHRIMYSGDSGKVVIRRAAEIRTGASGILLLKTHTPSDGASLADCLKRLNDTIKDDETPSERLNKIFENEIKAHTSGKTTIKNRKSEEISLLEANETRRSNATKPILAVKIGYRASALEQEQPVNIRRKRSLTIEDDTPAAQSRRQSLARKMTTVSSRGDETHDRSSETRLRGSELSDTRRTVKRVESINDFRPTTRALAHQENSYRQLRPIKSRSPSPPGWTKQNPRWQEERCWKTSLTYPTEGKQRATVDARDVERLDEGEFLNDNVIELFLRYLEAQLKQSHPELSKRIYIKNTFFYATLTKGKARSNNINYDAVKRWTNKVDIFSYDYIIVPVCENLHWYVAIICNTPKLLCPNKEVDQGLHEEDDVAILDAIHKPTASQKNQKDGLFSSMPISKTPKETFVVEQPRKPLRTNSASPSVTTQVEHMSLEDNKDEWPEAEASPQQWTSSSALVQNFGPAGEFIENLASKDDIEKEVESVDVPRRWKKLKRKSVPPPRKYDPREPRIITLDSLGGTHSPTCSNLRAYLVCEAKERKDINITPGSLGMTATGLPQQSNYCDCGVFLLGYVKKFLEDPDIFVRSILQKDVDQIRDWSEMDAARMRESIRKLIFRLHDDQTRRENEQRGVRYKAKKVSKNEAKDAILPAADISSLPRLIATKAISSANTSEPDDPIISQPSSPPIDIRDCKSAKNHTREVDISTSALVEVQRSTASPIEKPARRNHIKRKRITHNVDTTSTNFSGSQDAEVIETPAPSFGRHAEPLSRPVTSTDTSPSRTPVRRRISTINLDSPLDPARSKDNVVEEFANETGEKVTKSNIFKRFAKDLTSPYQNTRRRSGLHVSNDHIPVEVDSSKDNYEPEVHETPPRALEREESFEDILEIQDSDPPSTPPRRDMKGPATLTSSPPLRTSKSSPRTLRSSPRDSDRFVTLFEPRKHGREIRRTAKNWS